MYKDNYILYIYINTYIYILYTNIRLYYLSRCLRNLCQAAVAVEEAEFLWHHRLLAEQLRELLAERLTHIPIDIIREQGIANREYINTNRIY